MTAPAEYRSLVGSVKTNLPGVEIGGVFPKIARVVISWRSSALSLIPIPAMAAARIM
jgi:hypothetical protein